MLKYFKRGLFREAAEQGIPQHCANRAGYTLGCSQVRRPGVEAERRQVTVLFTHHDLLDAALMKQQNCRDDRLETCSAAAQRRASG